MGGARGRDKYAGIVGLEECDFDAFVFEVAFTLGKVHWSVVRRSVPVVISLSFLDQQTGVTHQLVKKVILSVDMLACFPQNCAGQYANRGGEGDQEAASPFAGIIQIKFERYNLRTSPSSINHICRKRRSLRTDMVDLGLA